jgi:hypothetical protein
MIVGHVRKEECRRYSRTVVREYVARPLLTGRLQRAVNPGQRMVAHVNHSSSRMNHSYESNGLTFGRGAVRAPMPWRYLAWLVFVAIHQRGNWQEVRDGHLQPRPRSSGGLSASCDRSSHSCAARSIWSAIRYSRGFPINTAPPTNPTRNAIVQTHGRHDVGATRDRTDLENQVDIGQRAARQAHEPRGIDTRQQQRLSHDHLAPPGRAHDRGRVMQRDRGE